MTKNPESDTKVLSLPSKHAEMPRLEIQSAANFLAGASRLNELFSLPENTMTAEQAAEAASIRKELGAFVSAHAVPLVQAYLQYAAILQPLQQSLSSIIVPCVAKALADRFDNSKPEVVSEK